MSASDCIETIRRAGKDLSDDEVLEIAERIQAARQRLIAEGNVASLDPRLRQLAREEGQKARLAAALQRRQAALNAIVRDRLERQIDAHVAAGLSYPKAVLAMLEGTARGIASGRVSVAATRLAFESRYLGEMLGAIQRERPHLLDREVLGDQAFLGDVVREMFELKEGGQPGKSGNADARAVARTFATFAELSRTDLNRLGANIGKLDGWAGPQVHDPHKLLRVTEDEWIKAILPRLDMERTFGRDQVRLDTTTAEQARVKAERDQLAQSVRLLGQGLDELDARAAGLESRKAELLRRREVATARLEERQGETAAHVDRYVGNLEREQDGRILLQMEGRDGAADRHSLRRREAARENAQAIGRLTRKSGQAHDLLARIDGQIARIEAELAQMPQRRQEVAARRDAAQGHLSGLNGRLKELDLVRGELRPGIEDPVEFLRQAYRTITTGRDSTITAAQKGEITGPANLARSLEKHRVLHFKSADDWLAYNAAFGHGNIFSAMVAHQSRAARLAAQMQVLGPNPEVMVGSLLDSLQLKIRNDGKIPDLDKAAQIRALTVDGHGRIASAFAEVRGLTLAPEHLTAADICSGIRAIESMSKLGGAVVSSISDLVTGVANLKFHGKPLAQAWGDQITEFLAGRGDQEQRELAYLIGEGFDGLIGHIVTPYVAGDGAPGLQARAMETFFRWSGLTWWTDVQRSAGARILSAYMGGKVGQAFGALDPRFRHGLSLHGLGEAEWEVLRQAQFRARNGNTYVTADRIRDLPAEVVERLVPAADIATARARFKVDETTMKQFKREVPVPPELQAERAAKFEAWKGRQIETARFELEMAVRRYFADEINFAVIETDDQTRRQMLWGTRPGSFWGEAARFVFQFKGFPLAFTNRVVGRALYGFEAGAPVWDRTGHIGHLLTGLMVAGYAAMTAKDVLRGWWPPRDPTDPRTILAALQQGGGAGIYGDFLFGQASRFGNGPLETIAGPSLGAGASFITLLMKARDGEAKAGDAFNLVLQNFPLLNLWYARPGLDFLALNSAHEALNPGYLGRMERRRRKEMGQHRLWDPQP